MAIEHVFVLMLENRSFDHLFGLTQRQETAIPASAGFSGGAPDRCPTDPVHEFDAVQTQINNGKMDGFKDPLACKGLSAGDLPTLNELASRYVLFDNWFSSVPGPTWPNRFFVHAASSGGLCTSPTGLRTTGAIIAASENFQFAGGTLFDLFDKKSSGDPAWRVYHGDVTPQCLALPGMVGKYYKGAKYFRSLYPTNDRDGFPKDDGFAVDVMSSAGYAPKYTFIEPNYALQIIPNNDFTVGDSMHPCGLASAGDALVRYVYDTLRGSPIWDTSVLLVVWDEHGGFYDHVDPKSATPPGDVEHNRAKGDDGADFKFDRLGVRVPAILIGPTVPTGKLGSELFPGQRFDHSSVVSTARSIFELAGPLTNRDRDAPTWDGCLATVASTADTALESKAITVNQVAPARALTQATVDGFTSGMGLIAMDLDKMGAKLARQPTIGDFTPKSVADFHAARQASLESGNFPTALGSYMAAVQERAAAIKARA